MNTNIAPAITPGWPQPVPGGTVHRTLAGGPAVIGTFSQAFAVSAFGLDGTRLWANWRIPGCGNCDDGPQVPALQADGTYGPIGPTGDDYWSVDQDGRVVQSCTGVVLADRRCVSARLKFVGGATTTPVPMLQSVRAGVTLWEFQEPNFSWLPESDAPPLVVRDGSGIVYTGFGAGTDTTTKAAAPARMIAVDSATGAFRWRQLDAEPLAALASGVVAKTAAGLTAYDGAGTVRWTSPVTGGAVADDVTSAAHTGPARVYATTKTGVVALDAATGAEAWRTAVADDARLLSIAPSGRLYVAVDRAGRTGLRAISPAGAGVWQLDTATRVMGARELADGTVALTTEGSHNGMGDLLLRVDPRRRAAVPKTARLTLSRSTVRVVCTLETCDLGRQFGTILRLDMPRATTATITMRERNGRPTPKMIVKTVTVRAGAGSSWVRLLVGERFMARGRHVVSVRWRDRGRAHVANLPVTVR